MNSGVYTITCTENGMTYCGSTKSFTNRKSAHFAELRNGCHHIEQMVDDFDQHGEEKFEFRIIEMIEDKRLYLQKEREMIDQLKAKNCCYNRPNDGNTTIKGSFDRKRLLRFLRANPQATHRDIMKAFKIRNISVAEYHLNKLMAAQKLRKIPARWEIEEKD
jgi:group I intron endonuclease